MSHSLGVLSYSSQSVRKKQLHDRIDSIGKKVKIPRKKKKTDEDVDVSAAHQF